MSSAFHLPVEPGYRFCICHHPEVQGGGGIVYVHPFCEEMNKARRMAALQCRQFAAAGYTVLQIDLLGCGDSSGEFGEARWAIWKRDIAAAVGWVRSRVNGAVSLWGLRLGATLAADFARDPDLGIEHLILWQPVSSGEQFLTQFLRVRLAAEMLAEGAAQTGVREMRKALHLGSPLEIAGYDLHPQLASEIDGLRLADLVPKARRVHWLEVTAHAGSELSAASRRTLEAWRARGLDIRATAVSGEPFWSTIEIAECRALLAATEESIADKSPAGARVS